MLASIALTFGLFLLSVSIHLATISKACAWAYKIGNKQIAFVAFMAAAFMSHCLAAGVFAVGDWIGDTSGIGAFAQEPAMSAMDYFYFSLVNITTLGLGDIYPLGHLRFMAGIESLTGFLLISISASYIFRFLAGKMEAGDGRHPSS